MNTDVLVAGGSAPLAPWFAEVERFISRFDPNSSLSDLNRRPGRWVVTPPMLFDAIHAAMRAARTTGGAFDPTILDSLEAAGYSRSFEQGPTPDRLPPPDQPPVPFGRWQEVKLVPAARAVFLPPGIRLDLGGIGKGLAVDGALDRLRGEPRGLVDAGGDIAFFTAAGDDPVAIEVADPFRPKQALITFRLYRGAVATSSTLGRAWGPGLHHLIDPRTGRPTASGIVAATVFAERAARAEILAKAAIVLGRERGLQLLAKQGCHGLLVSETGESIYTPGLEEYLDANA